MHLTRDPGIGRTEQADVRDALDQHQHAVQAHAQGQAVVAGEPGSGEYAGMREAAFPDFHPAAEVHVDLAAVPGVRVGPRLLAARQARDERTRFKGLAVTHGTGVTARRSAALRPARSGGVRPAAPRMAELLGSQGPMSRAGWRP